MPFSRVPDLGLPSAGAKHYADHNAPNLTYLSDLGRRRILPERPVLLWLDAGMPGRGAVGGLSLGHSSYQDYEAPLGVYELCSWSHRALT